MASDLEGWLGNQHLFCFGCGYAALRLAKRVLAAGGQVSGTSRTREGAQRLAGAGVRAHVFDGESQVASDAFDGVTSVLTTIPPQPDGDDGVLHWHAARLAALPTLGGSAVLSTTGVYGDTGGAWIDEGAPLRPANDRARARVACEGRWLAWAEQSGKLLQVFRLPGIYGPERSPFARLRAGTAQRIQKAGHVFNRIHVDDIATAVLLGLRQPQQGPIFHLADDEPSPAADVIAHAASLLGVAPPPAVDAATAELSPMARQFYAECKRLDTTRAKTMLGFAPRYPTYREGLAAVLAEEALLSEEPGRSTRP